MENKKGTYSNTSNHVANDSQHHEPIPKHSHQHNTAPQHLRLLQYGLKIPNHQHSQTNQSHQHSPLNSANVHLHLHQPYYQQPGYKYLQTSPQQFPSQSVHQNQNLHQHNQQNQSQLYCTNSPPPPPLHPHNPLNQQNPQIWVPHQPPVHYHQQKPETQSQKQTTTTTPKPKEPVERKKSAYNSNQQLRSPVAKRPPEAPVTMHGWLHKQGSEGLMLWKKRWFVLSDYCLFYYKGPEEEKVLGSVLLPSYKVSICKPEDKINRKHAFKCEHANMRTYVLAADSQELMLQWVRVLNLACLLQNNVELDQQSSQSVSTYVQSGENSDSGFHQQYSQKQNVKTMPVHLHTSSNTTELSNPSQQEFNQYNQPLYANAPPKPRRLNDGGYSSPSPDLLDRYQPEPKYISPQHPYHMPPQCVIRNAANSPIHMYSPNVRNQQPEYVTQVPPHHSLNKKLVSDYVYEYNVPPNAERRTPDTYGRSKSNPTKSRTSDYEDVYADQYMYKRPLSPLAYSNVKKATPSITPMHRTYTPVSMLGPRDIVRYVPPQQMRKSPRTIPRPHSADFLEYEVAHRQSNPNTTNKQPRPKSSLDINRNTSNDNYFYTEERYAEKMRKSVQYLPKVPRYIQQQTEYMQQKCPRENDKVFPLMKSNTQPINFNNSATEYSRSDLQPVRSRSVLSEGSLSKELDVDLRCSPHDHSDRGGLSPAPLSRQEQIYGYAEDVRRRDYDHFTRSASARLSENAPSERLQLDGSLNREGERKREESMKRLLEWKQRMLQSPLNRKVHQSTNKIFTGKPDMYHKHLDNGYVQKLSADSYLDGKRPANAMPQYNSYSSDDEENEERSKGNTKTQAGRTVDTVPSDSFSPAHSASTTVFNTPHDEILSTSDDLHAIKDTCTNKYSEIDDTFTKPLKLYNKEAPHVAHVSSLRSEFSEKFEENPVITEVKSNDALVKSILAEFEKKTDEDGKIKAVEENYMTMTPKKNILEPTGNVTTERAESDENPYVEMTQGCDISLLNSENLAVSNEHQPYETVCFSEGKMEPVYMELSQPQNTSENKESKTELPDILMQSQSKKYRGNKSDSSDADDEASKDLDSLDTPSHPRFSLSDTFRPASYYLGVSQTVPELQDSSDSELVSPPPIPRSPPPLDELDECSKKIDYRLSQSNQNLHQYFTKFNNKGSTHSLDIKNQNFSSLTNLKTTYDNVSLCSVNTETERRYGSRLSHNSDSDVELRPHLSRNNEYERMLKRRPVSEEFCDELDSLDSRFNESVDLDKYLKDLQSATSNEMILRNYLYLSAKIAPNQSVHDYENVCIVGRGASDLKDENENSARNTRMVSPLLVYSHGKEDVQNISATQSNLSESRSLLSPDCIQRSRPESCTSITAEINGFLHNSRRSTPSIRAESSMSNQENLPVSLYFQEGKSNQGFNQNAPYYYSDLSVNTSHTDSTSTILTLNNQRASMIGSKRDITHIVNPIRCNIRPSRNTGRNPRQNLIRNTFKLAAEARSVSVDFLNLTDKSGQIDKKNIYESDTLKRLKAMDSITSLQSNPETRNLYPSITNDKFYDLNTGDFNVRRTHSLEGLLENVLSETTETTSVQDSSTVVAQSDLGETDVNNGTTEGSYLWEEDSIWHERLRSASQRHTKSLDDLDCISEPKTEKYRKQTRGITRGVTYVNDNIYNMLLQDKNQKGFENENSSESKGKETSFIIDREKLRQWDLLSSAPSDAQIIVQCAQGVRVNNMVVDMGDEVIGSHTSEQINIQEQASGSVCINTRDTFPKAVSKRMWVPNSQLIQSRLSAANLPREDERDYSMSDRQAFYMSQVPSHHDLSLNGLQSNTSLKGNWQWGGRMNMSAGELLGRTHEELVLLLIQLRRQSTNTCNAIEACYNEIDCIQAQLHLMDAAKRLENIQKLEQIKQHLLALEKQYEKGKPLVNLVDNMVKLGSLYRSSNDHTLIPYVRDRLEFNQQIQERRLLAEERRDWNRLSPNHAQLQEKVQQLYHLDRLIQEESGTLQGLQQDKEDIERALGGLRQRLNKGFNDPAEVEQARKQQTLLENELSRVHLMLAQNSKKLEETVVGNARLEQELLVLKQKLQISRLQRSSPQFSNAGDSLPCVLGTSAMLESDLQRVQQKVGDLQRQRQELSMQVRQLTDRSNNLQQEMRPLSGNLTNQGIGNKKKVQSLWRETDLDTMDAIDHGDSWESTVPITSTSPLYINTNLKQNADPDFYNRGLKLSDSTSDDTMLSSNFTPQEKPEIKTVRIVKRESERRQRDREKTSSTGKCDPLAEEPSPMHKTQSIVNIGALSPSFMDSDKINNEILCRQSSLSSPNLQQEFSPTTKDDVNKSPELALIFKSEAAKQIITEMSSQEVPKQLNRRAVPKEKRRHYTAPNNNLIMKSLNQLPIDDNMFDKLNSRRARDDLDMERALRQRIDTPDVVRSTLSNKELKYNESTIDNILGTPNKISIPERYIPEQVPQLSAEEQEHRLKKVESIKKMLSDSTIISSSANPAIDVTNSENSPSSIVSKATTKMIEEKKQREHLLQLNQILAKQVMEMSKIVAGTNNSSEQ